MLHRGLPWRGSGRRTSPLSQSPALVYFEVLLTVVSGVGVGGSLSGNPAPLSGLKSSSATPASIVPSVTFPTSVRHVVTVLLENENSGTVLSQGPFEQYLIRRYGYANNYYAICHPSAANYLGISSGASHQCGSDSYNVYNSPNIADLVQNAGLTWGGYMESMPSPCDTSDGGNYVVRHDPFVYYSDIVSNAGRCDSHVVDFTAWNSSVNSGDIPNYAFITPNVLDDGHNTNVSYADHWLKGWLSPLMNDSFFQSTVFFITYDESGSTTTGYDGLDGGKVYFAAVGPDVSANFTYTANAAHYDLLATTEWLLGVGDTGNNDCSASFPPMESLFEPSNSRMYVLSGQVIATDTGKGISGATVEAGCGSSATTNSSGGYELDLANGTYVLTVSATGFASENGSVVVAGAPRTENFELKPNPASPSSPALASWVYIVLGAAIVAAGSGGVVTVWRRRRRPPADVGRAPPSPPPS
jgi:hypothetical protein